MLFALFQKIFWTEPPFEDKLIGGKVRIHGHSVSLPVIWDNESFYEIDPISQRISYIVLFVYIDSHILIASHWMNVKQDNHDIVSTETMLLLRKLKCKQTEEL